MEDKKVVLEFDLFEIVFILNCMYIGSNAYRVINSDLVLSDTLGRITDKFYEVLYKIEK